MFLLWPSLSPFMLLNHVSFSQHPSGRPGSFQSVPWDSAVKGRPHPSTGEGKEIAVGEARLLRGARAQAEGPHEWRE